MPFDSASNALRSENRKLRREVERLRMAMKEALRVTGHRRRGHILRCALLGSDIRPQEPSTGTAA